MSSDFADLPPAGATVVVGMSGGVDSTLVALLLKENGCHVIGATMSSWCNDLPLPRNPEGVRNSCYGPDEQLDIDACKTFCREHNIEHIVVDVAKPYHEKVLDYFKSEYRSGRTPNPCVFCNPAVKFGAFLDGIKANGIAYDYFCTGHYARLVRAPKNLVQGWNMSAKGTGVSPNVVSTTGVSPKDALLFDDAAHRKGASLKNDALSFGATTSEELQPLLIANAIDGTKDQTYFLNRLSSEVLETVKFPLGTLTKARVYALARERHLVSANRRESQDFIPSEYLAMLFADKPSVEGDIVDLDGNVLGKHRGIEWYTIGQRRGLGVSAKTPLYVHSIDAKHNRVVLSEESALTRTALIARNWVWPNGIAPTVPFTADVKIRLASKAVRATVTPLECESGAGEKGSCGAVDFGGAVGINGVRGESATVNGMGAVGSDCASGARTDFGGAYRVEFSSPVRAVAPGQAAVLYIDGMIVGGGIISQEM